MNPEHLRKALEIRARIDPEAPKVICCSQGVADSIQRAAEVAGKMPTEEEIQAYDGDDLYRWVASRVAGKPESEISTVERDFIKKALFARTYGGSS